MTDEIVCQSQNPCWGNGHCETFLNNSNTCFDGGDCNYRYGKTSKCSNTKCCESGAFGAGSELCRKYCDCGIYDSDQDVHVVPIQKAICDVCCISPSKCIIIIKYIPYARHYNPRFVYFLPTF